MPHSSHLQYNVITDLAEIDPAQWDRLAPNPLLRHAWLINLTLTACADPHTGWQPVFITLHEHGILVAALPLYLKSHSYGEYIFDWAWANAFAQHGLDYYPKLVAGIPFTPVPGPRILLDPTANASQHLTWQRGLIQQSRQLAEQTGASSIHVLWTTPAEHDLWLEIACVGRQNVQFHFQNPGYPNLEAFLATLERKKRKNILQEQRKLAEQGIHFRVLRGPNMVQADWDFAYACYQRTYLNHHNAPYLNPDFFAAVARDMPEAVTLIVAEQHGRPLAMSFLIESATHLYGRYWGTLGETLIPGLHFATCYTEALRYAIDSGKHTFEGGAQGEHKMARGFMPVSLPSAHWIAHPKFRDAIAHHAAQESTHIHNYLIELENHSPYKQAATPDPASEGA